MPKNRAVGIDLGTTYSASAWIDDAGKSELVPNAEGDLLTPSVVLFEDDQVIVGKEAKKVALTDADRVAICVKRDMGKPVYNKAINGQYLPPEVIQSYILRKMRRDITRKIGPDFATVITVPAYFDEPRRKATYQAGEMAGLNVLDILNEPTAAALAYGEEQGYLTKFGAPKERMRVVVYDLGGGTFDVTLIDMQPGDLKTICTDGDMQLGGHDWDMRLVDFMAAAYLKEFGEDPRLQPGSLQRMLQSAEEGKHTLSVRNRTKLFVTHGGRAMEVPITRQEFEEMSADLLERTRYTTKRLITAAGLEWKAIDRILLTGGSTRMPMVQKMLKELTGLDGDTSISPDEAVARGAAIYAQYLLASKGDSGHKPTFDVTNVNAHSLGIQGSDPKTGRKRNKILIPRNTPLPAKKTTRCVTKKVNQDNVVVRVLEGESLDPKECSAIGRTVINDLPPNLPKGWPIDVTYEYGVNGRLHVTAKVRGTDKEVHLELERDESMSADRLNRWKGVLDNDGGLDAFDMAVMEELKELKKHAPAPKPAPSPPASAAATSGALRGQRKTKAAPQTTSQQPAPTKQTPAQPTVVQSNPPQQPAAGKPPAGQPQPAAAPPNQPKPAPVQPIPFIPTGPQSPVPTQQPVRPVAPQSPATPQPVTPQPVTPQPVPTQPVPTQPVAQTPMVAFTCPHCRGVFQVPATLAGQQTQCPGCRGALIVPNVRRA
jgi:molecular chaperone DnaK